MQRCFWARVMQLFRARRSAAGAFYLRFHALTPRVRSGFRGLLVFPHARFRFRSAPLPQVTIYSAAGACGAAIAGSRPRPARRGAAHARRRWNRAYLRCAIGSQTPVAHKPWRRGTLPLCAVPPSSAQFVPAAALADTVAYTVPAAEPSLDNPLAPGPASWAKRAAPGRARPHTQVLAEPPPGGARYRFLPPPPPLAPPPCCGRMALKPGRWKSRA